MKPECTSCKGSGYSSALNMALCMSCGGSGKAAHQPKEAGQARELRSLIDLCERQIDADSRDCTTMQWHLTETPKRILAVLKAALASAPAQTVPEGFRLVPAAETPEWRAKLTRIGYSTKTVIADVLAAAPVAQQGSKG